MSFGTCRFLGLRFLDFKVFGSSFGSCWGGVHQFCLSMDNILRNLESLSRTELVWLNTYLVGRLRALPPENDSRPALPEVEPHGFVAMQGPNGVTSQQEAKVAPLPDRIDALNSSLDPWERTEAAPQGWATHLRQAMVPESQEHLPALPMSAM